MRPTNLDELFEVLRERKDKQIEISRLKDQRSIHERQVADLTSQIDAAEARIAVLEARASR